MLNLLQISFLFLTLSLSLFGALVNWFSNYLPLIILKFYNYGKFSIKESVSLTIQVPKRWFRHFYVFSSLWSLCALYIMYCTYTGQNIPSEVKNFLIVWRTKTGTVPASVSFLAMSLMAVQCVKRFYETHFVSVFSDAEMDISHYIVGHFHYFGAVLAILCEAPGIIYPEEKYTFSPGDIGFRHIVPALIFLWASRNQLKSAEILGNLRKNKEGEVITQKYKIPYGGYFELVSCPHQLFEVVMYMSLSLILWGNETWPFVTIWVTVNQVETSYLSHRWYKKTFKDYPKQRKAIIPFIL